MSSNYYEFITRDSSGNVWNWEDGEDNVVINAPDPETAMQILMESVDSEFEDDAMKYYPRLISDIDEYVVVHHTVEWGV